MLNEIIYEELVQGILKTVGTSVINIFLYGSAARGTATVESDIDIAILVTDELTFEQSDSLSDFIVDMNLKYDKVFSVIDISIEKFEKWKSVLPFYRNVETQGISLWKAA